MEKPTTSQVVKCSSSHSATGMTYFMESGQITFTNHYAARVHGFSSHIPPLSTETDARCTARYLKHALRCTGATICGVFLAIGALTMIPKARLKMHWGYDMRHVFCISALRIEVEKFPTSSLLLNCCCCCLKDNSCFTGAPRL